MTVVLHGFTGSTTATVVLHGFTGSTTATVVLHGFTGSAAAMVPLTSRLPEPVLALDLPGHGPGAISDDPADYTIAAAVAGVIDTKFAAIVQAQVYLIPEAGHAAHLEAPDATAAAVVRCASS